MTQVSSPVRRRALRLAALLALAAASLSLLSACGSSNDSAGSSATTAPSSSSGGGAGSGDDDAGRVRLAQCLRDNGVDLPDNIGQGGQPPQNLDREKVQSLLQGACKEYVDGAFGNISADQRQEMRDAFAVYSQCMRDNGVDLPDLGAGGGMPDASAIDRDSPTFKKAQEACQDKLPQGLPGGGN